MSYCLNPTCPKPINHPKAKKCKACGAKLLLRDRYHLLKGLGKGGFGATFLAADLSLPGNPLCVIKQLRPNTDNPNFLSMARELFEREAKTLGRIGNHPQIPRLLDYFEDRQQFYLIQEFVKGNNLQQEVKKNGVLNETQIRQVLKEVLVILRDIHAQKVIHRDIKPANIIRREIDDRLVLIDFGVVKNQGNTVAGGEATALTAFAVGTPGFAPPEQLAMRPVYSSDVYALGVTCIYLMTGKAPKNLDCDPITGEIDWFKNVRVNDSFAEILTKMLEVSVKNRYKTADEVLQALDIENHIDSLADSIISYPKVEEARSTSFRTNGSSLRRNTLSNPRQAAPKAPHKFGGRFSHRGKNFNKLSSNTEKLDNADRKTTARAKPEKLEAETVLDAYAKGRRDFGFKDFSRQNLEKSDLSGSNFQNSITIKTNFLGTDLSSCDFTGTDMRQAIMRQAKLNRTFLINANLEGADLRGADLSEANFDGCKLKGVNLSGANLTNAKIDKEQLDIAKTNWLTILPNGRRGFW